MTFWFWSCEELEICAKMTIINFVTHGTSSSWVRTKHGPGVHGPPLWTGSMDHVHGPGPWTPCHGPGPWTVFFIFIRIRFCTRSMDTQKQKYSRTPLFRTRLIRSPRYFEGRSNSLGFTLLLYASPVISKPRYFELFPISLGTSK